MAQNVTVAGASYTDVPSVVLPKTGGGSATFLDTTIASNAAAASDIMSGKLAYVNGALVEGTGTGGGGGSVTQDANGYIILPATGGGGGGGSNEIESGVIRSSSQSLELTINFQNQHSTLPFFYAVFPASGTYDSTLNAAMLVQYINYESAFGYPLYNSETSLRYGDVYYKYRSTSATSLSSGSTGISQPLSYTGSSSSGYPRYWVSETQIKAHSGNSSVYWQNNKEYKWIAVWAPTT